jgi:hypothetical protein
MQNLNDLYFCYNCKSFSNVKFSPYMHVSTICYSFINNTDILNVIQMWMMMIQQRRVVLIYHWNYANSTIRSFHSSCNPSRQTNTKAIFYVVPHLNQFRFRLGARYPLASFIQRSVTRKRF